MSTLSTVSILKLRRLGTGLLVATFLGGSMAAPLTANAQDRYDDASHHRQQTKNTWRNVAVGSGALGVLGLFTHNSTLAIAGTAGSLYSLSRYEHDRKSQSKMDHDHADLYGRRSFDYKGHHYVRHTVRKNGQQYYKFVRE